MKNFVQAGNNLTVAAPYDLTSGDGALINSLFGVAAGDADNGAEVDLVTVGVFELPKTSALAISIGEKLYWDNVAKEVNKTSSGNTLIGVAASAALNPSASVNVRLNGAF